MTPTMHIELLVEEQSAEAALRNILPRMLPTEVTFAVHPHSGKHDLLARLPGRLAGYRRWIPPDYRIVILIDQDNADCRALKRKLNKMVAEVGLIPKSKAHQGTFQVLNRLAIEELEAWFFGDPQALSAAYPKIPVHLLNRSWYRTPDSIAGGTAEALERILKNHRYYRTGMPKIEVARSISAYMDPARNRSKSFQVFREGIQEIVASREVS